MSLFQDHPDELHAGGRFHKVTGVLSNKTRPDDMFGVHHTPGCGSSEICFDSDDTTDLHFLQLIFCTGGDAMCAWCTGHL